MEWDFESLDNMNHAMSDAEKASVLVMAMPGEFAHIQTVLETFEV